MRQDAKKNLQKVATEVLKDPLASRDEIAKRTGLSQGNVSDKLTKLDGAIDRTSTVVRIAETDLEHIEKIQSIENSHIDEYLDQANRGEMLKPADLEALNRIGDRKQKRYSLLIGENVNPDGGEKKIEIISYKDA